MRIGIDIDDTLADLVTSFTEFHNEAYGTSLEKADFITYATWQIVGGTHEDDLRKFAEFDETPYAKNMKPMDGARVAIDVLSKTHELFIITARPDSFVKETHFWLQKHFTEKFKGIHFAQDYKTASIARQNKADIVTQLGVQIFIDDNMRYAEECAKTGTKVLLFNQPWNQTPDLAPGITRVHSWEEILRIIGRM